MAGSQNFHQFFFVNLLDVVVLKTHLLAKMTSH